MSRRASSPQGDHTSFACSDDHSHCIEEALSRAEQVCATEGERFTDLRRQVLELVWSGHKPAKAYDLVSQLAARRSGVAPTTVYRTLDFLQSLGLVHKLESLNAYLGCSAPLKDHQGHFLICERCEEVQELDFNPFNRSISRLANDMGFQVRRSTVELSGLCASCKQSDHTQAK